MVQLAAVPDSGGALSIGGVIILVVLVLAVIFAIRKSRNAAKTPPSSLKAQVEFMRSATADLVPDEEVSGTGSTALLEERLATIDNLFYTGALTKDEYNEARKNLLEKG